ncbi:hypothetical protein NDU88_006425 [Pleurodeles waltl]|uniref:Uncharacterized protein n=1 Tax=Pleurodeles waltl TaxID=8319 RepID=A0AAV7MFU8_PLEWA|nr:hypothetical protein NDU88_006425 [Pleurodeles waltl]
MTVTMGVITTLAEQVRQGRGTRWHRRQAGGAPRGILTAAAQPRSEKGNRRSPAGFPLPQRNPPSRRSMLRRHGDSDSPSRHPVPGGSPAGNRMAGGGVAGPLGAPAVPMPMAWARQGPP